MHLLSTLSGVAGVALHVGGWSARVLRRCCHKMHVTELLCPLGGPDGLHCLVLGTLCNNRDFLPTSMRLVKLPSLYDSRQKFSHSSWRERSFEDVRCDHCVPLNR